MRARRLSPRLMRSRPNCRRRREPCGWEMGRLREELARDKIKLDPEAGLHTLRHTFLTEAGEHTDAFTLQYIAGHDTIRNTMRYVHPRVESVSRAFGRINQRKKPAEPA